MNVWVAFGVGVWIGVVCGVVLICLLVVGRGNHDSA